jgi:hypothetical protein
MSQFLVATLVVTLMTGISTTQVRAAVNCSYDVCLKLCAKGGATGIGCNTWCSKAMTERRNNGQCKK